MASLPLANTEEGKRFVVKALHPADHELKTQQVPKGTNNTVCVTLDEAFDIAPQGHLVRLITYPHPIAPVVVEVDTANDGTFSTRRVFVSTAWGGNNTGLVNQMAMSPITALSTSVEAGRITHQSVTCELVAPALANQGRVASAQYTLYSQRAYANTTFTGAGNSILGGGTLVKMYYVYDKPPEYESLLAGHRAFTSQATSGAYVPLRLTDEFGWHATNDICGGLFVGKGSDNPPFNPNDLCNVVARDLIPNGISASTGYFPMMWGTTASVTYFSGLDVNANIHVRIRQGTECRTRPGTVLAGLSQVPPLADPLALKMYDEIAGRMEDAYPASYNDWATLKKKIASIGRAVLPFAEPLVAAATSALPMGGVISPIATQIVRGVRQKLEDSAPKVDNERTARRLAVQDASAKLGNAVANQLKAKIRK